MIERRIYLIRGHKIMLDSDLADLGAAIPNQRPAADRAKLSAVPREPRG